MFYIFFSEHSEFGTFVLYHVNGLKTKPELSIDVFITFLSQLEAKMLQYTRLITINRIVGFYTI